MEVLTLCAASYALQLCYFQMKEDKDGDSVHLTLYFHDW